MSEFIVNTRIFFGENYQQNLFQFLGDYRFKTILPMVDDAVLQTQVVKDIFNEYKSQGYVVQEPYPLNMATEPTYTQLDNIVAELRSHVPDLIIAIGGGSAIDLTKCVAALLKNMGKGVEFRGFHKIKNPGVPLVAYPSTAGTGTEVTWNAPLIDTEEKKKMGINGNNLAPLCGVLEPKLVASCPVPVAVSSGLDVMVHAIEAATSKTATELTIALSKSAFAMVYENLPLCVADQRNMRAWEKMQFAAYLAGIAIMNAGGGPAGSLSYLLGVRYRVPHGIAGGVLLPGIFKINTLKGYNGYTSFYNFLHDANHELSDEDKRNDFIIKFNQFYDRIRAPRNLKQWVGINEKECDELVNIAITDYKNGIALNPVPFLQQDVKELLEMVCFL